MPCLILAEHDQHGVHPSTRSVINAALQLDTEVDLLIAAKNAQHIVQYAQSFSGIRHILVVEAAHYEHGLAEEYEALLFSLAEEYRYFLASSHAFGKSVMPRLAARLDVAQITDVVEILGEGRFKRPIYAGNVLATIASCDPKLVMTIRPTAFEKVSEQGGNAVVKTLQPLAPMGRAAHVKDECADKDQPDLNTARIVLAGGRGLGDAESFAALEALAQKIPHCGVGASRAAVDAGYIGNDCQIGQTGKTVAPELYIALGISGAIQHVAGMKDSRLVVAVNKDEDAPIFDCADYGFVGDVEAFLLALEKAVDGG